MFEYEYLFDTAGIDGAAVREVQLLKVFMNAYSGIVLKSITTLDASSTAAALNKL